MREALHVLGEAAPDLGIPPAESAPWRAAAAVLGDPLLVALVGDKGSGKTTLAGALGGAALEGDSDSTPALTMWKYGFEESDIADGAVTEHYRPVPELRSRAYVEIASHAFDDGAEMAERAYTMADVVLFVFSADDPWGKDGWSFLRGIHKRRERPAAAVLTHTDGRTDEEVDAIVEYLRKTSKAAIAEELPVFVVGSLSRVAGAEGVSELATWVGDSGAARPAYQERVVSAERALLSAAESVAAALRGTVDDTDAEAECVRWIDAETARELSAANAEAAGAMAPARETFQDRTTEDRGRLSRALGLFGIPGSLLKGGGWVRRAGTAAADAAAQKAEEGARGAVRSAGDRLSDLRRRITERVTGVFGEEAVDSIPKLEEIGDPSEVGRRAAARVREAAGDREAGAEVAARVGTRRLLLIIILALAVVAAGAGLRFFALGQGSFGALSIGAAAVIILWGGVLLRGRKRAILTAYDREVSTARDAIGRDLAGVTAPVIEKAFERFSTGLAPIRERAASLASDRAGLRARVLEAIELAAESGHRGE